MKRYVCSLLSPLHFNAHQRRAPRVDSYKQIRSLCTFFHPTQSCRIHQWRVLGSFLKEMRSLCHPGSFIVIRAISSLIRTLLFRKDGSQETAVPNIILHRVKLLFPFPLGRRTVLVARSHKWRYDTCWPHLCGTLIWSSIPRHMILQCGKGT